MNIKKISVLGTALLGVTFLMGAQGGGCMDADDQDRQQQEKMLQQGHDAVGLPAITHFTEKKLLKMVLEMRDQERLQTWTYIVAEQTGQLVFLGRTVGFGIPYSTEFTNPQKPSGNGYAIPQADPNGLFSPSSSEGTWILMLDPKTKDMRPVYIESRIIVSPFPLK